VNGKLKRTCISRCQFPIRPAQPARQHLSNVQAGHDRFASSRIVGEQESQPGKFQHVVVNCDPLVREGVDAGNLGRKGRVGEVPEGKPFTFNQCGYNFGVGRKIKKLWSGSVFFWLRILLIGLTRDFTESAPGQLRRCGLAVFPATVGKDTPSFSASMIWVSPMRIRSCLICFG
jgi:hypothetical protein